MPDATLFKQKLQSFLRHSGYTQKTLADELGLHHQVLSRKLSDKRADYLTRFEIKQIIKILVTWKSLTSQSQVLDLLNFTEDGFDLFTEVEWNESPLKQLRTGEDNLHPAEKVGLTQPNSNNPPASHYTLPAQFTSFIGREALIRQAIQLFQAKSLRLITLVGPGGSGKTRLGLEIARQLQLDLNREICFIALAGISDPAQVVTALIQALGIIPSKKVPSVQGLITFLNDHKVFLLIDNFEHVTGATGLIAELLSGVPDLKIMVTSRVVLHLYGEQELRVPPLGIIDAQTLAANTGLTGHEAVRLFAERASLVLPEFTLTRENAPTIARICNYLDGLPLAIELAAAQVKLMPLAGLLEQLRRQKLDLATPANHNFPARHRTLRDTLSWSYQLLEPPEKRLFCLLGIFRGSFTLNAVEAIYLTGNNRNSSAVLALLTSLVDKSLISPSQSRAELPAFEAASEGLSQMPCFSMLETVREFALEQLEGLNNVEQILSLYLSYYNRLVCLAGPRIQGPDQLAWLTLLDAEQDNVRAAIENCFTLAGIAPDPGDVLTKGLEMAYHLFIFWDIRSLYSEGRNYISRLLELAHQAGLSESATYARTFSRLGIYVGRMGNYTEAQRLLEESRQQFNRLGLTIEEAECINYQGNFALVQGHLQLARQLDLQALKLSRQLDGTIADESILLDLGKVETALENYPKAANYFLECLPLLQKRGRIRLVGFCFNELGFLAVNAKDYQAGINYYLQGYAIQLKLGDTRGMAASCRLLGLIAYYEQDYLRALNFYRESLILSYQIGDRIQTGETLALLAVLHGQPDFSPTQSPEEPHPQTRLALAAALFGYSNAQLTAIGSNLNPPYTALYNEKIELLRNSLSQDIFSFFFEQGSRLNLEQVLHYLNTESLDGNEDAFLEDLTPLLNNLPSPRLPPKPVV